MPHTPKSLELFLLCLCLCCLRKTKDLRPVKTIQQKNNILQKKKDYEALLQKYFWPEYTVGNPDLPTVICSPCRKKLVKSQKDGVSCFSQRPQYEGYIIIYSQFHISILLTMKNEFCPCINVYT